MCQHALLGKALSSLCLDSTQPKRNRHRFDKTTLEPYPTYSTPTFGSGVIHRTKKRKKVGHRTHRNVPIQARFAIIQQLTSSPSTAARRSASVVTSTATGTLYGEKNARALPRPSFSSSGKSCRCRVARPSEENGDRKKRDRKKDG